MHPSRETLTRPLRFQVPVNIEQCFGEEYSARLSPMSTMKTCRSTERIPLVQGYPNCVMNWVEYRDGLLIAEVSLDIDVSMEAGKRGTQRAKNMSIATCLLLSWKLLM